jgi:hypothetical protein
MFLILVIRLKQAVIIYKGNMLGTMGSCFITKNSIACKSFIILQFRKDITAKHAQNFCFYCLLHVPVSGACNFKLKLALEFCALSTVAHSKCWVAFIVDFFLGLQTKVASESPDSAPGTGLPRIFHVQMRPGSPNKMHHLQTDFFCSFTKYFNL